MTRDDSVLSTGMSSASFGSVKEQKIRADKREEKQERRHQLLPSGKVVVDEIDKEIAELSSIKFAHVKELVASGIPHALEIDMLSNEKTIDHLTKVKNRLNNILRDNVPTPEEPTNE